MEQLASGHRPILPTFYSVEDIKRDYEHRSHGHFFDKSAMRFFRSRLTSHFKKISDTEYLFITTEQAPHDVRRANVRKCTVTIDPSKFCGYRLNIDTYGLFNYYTVYQARKFMNSIPIDA